MRWPTSYIHPGRGGATATLDSDLERDFGIDSLGRIELLSRMERRFGTVLPDQPAVTASTPRDLLRALSRASPARSVASLAASERVSAPRGWLQETPEPASTLLEVLDWHVERHPDRPDLALLQYTSGSTGHPKGVVLRRPIPPMSFAHDAWTSRNSLGWI